MIRELSVLFWSTSGTVSACLHFVTHHLEVHPKTLARLRKFISLTLSSGLEPRPGLKTNNTSGGQKIHAFLMHLRDDRLRCLHFIIQRLWHIPDNFSKSAKVLSLTLPLRLDLQPGLKISNSVVRKFQVFFEAPQAPLPPYPSPHNPTVVTRPRHFGTSAKVHKFKTNALVDGDCCGKYRRQPPPSGIDDEWQTCQGGLGTH